MSQERDNIKAGLFVVIGAATALVVVFLLADFSRWFDVEQTVAVRYKLADGLKGLEVGAEVTLGDQPVGQVTDIRDVIEEERVVGKLVEFTLPARYKLFHNAVIEAKAPAIGSGTKLNIRSVGDEGAYQRGQVIRGSVAGSELTRNLLTDMGITERQRLQFQNIIRDVEIITHTLSENLPAITASARDILDGIEPLVADAKKTLDEMRAAMVDVKAMTASGKTMMATAEKLLDDKDEGIRDSLDNINAITRDVREKTLAQVNEAIAKADAALANLQAATVEVKALAVGQRPVIELAIANAQLTTDQLKLAAIEVRRSPWRLLYKPGDEEIEADNLYDAARSFALAAGTLDAAAQSLAVAQSTDADSAATLNAMLDHLEKLFGRYQEAEAAFWEELEK